eukprot:TRINITY_DN18824_c0_g1_i1.p1 TRINITY_DN18824_c0_g1~~TRINITY_DN18824_c0_g1_i1.p1  ORF type:complete len:685 (+),score=233.48 TRINITY_DN18824_c0_g1_i1:51-2057(+)
MPATQPQAAPRPPGAGHASPPGSPPVRGDVLSDDEDDVGYKPACELYLGFTPGDEHITRFAQCLRSKLLGMGIACTMPLSADVGSVSWRRELVKLLKRCGVYLPLVTADWLRSGEALLELYYGLRRSAACSSPVVLPVLFPDAEASGCALAQRMRQQCFHCSFTAPTPLATLVDQIRNFLQELKFPMEKCCLHDGSSFRDLYMHFLRDIGLKRANSQVLKLLDGLGRTDTLDLSTDLSTSPPTAFLIGDQGLRPLLPVIKMKADLRKLVLRGNGLTNNSMHGLVEALMVHPSVTYLDLGDNDITRLGAAELCYLLRRNQQITTMHVDGTRIDSQVWLRRIERQLEDNRGGNFGSWSSLEHGRGFDEAAEAAWWQQAAARQSPLGSRPADEWDVVLCAKGGGGPEGNRATSVDLRVSARPAARGRRVQPVKIALSADDPLRARVDQYLKLLDSQTVSVKKASGATLKLVLEPVGGGLEAIQDDARSRVALLPTEGLQRVSIRLLFEKAPGSRQQSFFVDSTLWFDGDRRLAKELPQLFRENIQRFTGSLSHEVECLIERLYDDELVLDEEREALQRLELEEEERQEKEEQDRMDSIVDYWRASVPMFKQKLDQGVLEKLRHAREAAKRSQGVAAVPEAISTTTKRKLAEIGQRYAREVARTPACPPYWC